MDDQTALVRLRNVLAELYSDEPGSRRVVADAGLDARHIGFSNRAVDNWQAILEQATKAAQLDSLVNVALAEFEKNDELQEAWRACRQSTAEGKLSSSARETELAYLNALVTQYEYWAEKYTPLAGIAEVRAATVDGPRLDLPQPFMPTGFEKLIEHGFGEQRRVERVPVDDLRAAVTQYKRLVLLGEPGSGKTTTLWRLVYDYAQAALSDEDAPLPVLVPLGGYTTAETPLQYCRQYFGQLSDQLETYLHNKRVILLLDALNEMPRLEYRSRVQRIQHFLTDNRDVPVVVTCRVLDYSETLALEKLDIKPLDLERQRAYLHHYLDEVYGEPLFWQLAGGDPVKELWQSWTAVGGTWDEFWYGEAIPNASDGRA